MLAPWQNMRDWHHRLFRALADFKKYHEFQQMASKKKKKLHKLFVEKSLLFRQKIAKKQVCQKIFKKSQTLLNECEKKCKFRQKIMK